MSTPKVAIAKESAMAVTGGPNNLPKEVVVPQTCASAALPNNTAQLPHASEDSTSGSGMDGMTENNGAPLHRCRKEDDRFTRR